MVYRLPLLSYLMFAGVFFEFGMVTVGFLAHSVALANVLRDRSRQDILKPTSYERVSVM